MKPGSKSGKKTIKGIKKAAGLARSAVKNPKTFTQFYIWGGDSVWNADKGRRSPNMIGGMVRAERQQVKRQEKRTFNRVMNQGSSWNTVSNMRNTPETVFETQAPPSRLQQGIKAIRNLRVR